MYSVGFLLLWLYGAYELTICDVASAIGEMDYLWMNFTVLVPLILLPTPLASCPNSFMEDFVDSLLYSGWQMSWQ